MSEQLEAFTGADDAAALDAADRLLNEGRAKAFAASVVSALAGEWAWRREIVLGRLGRVERGALLLDGLVEALREPAHAERRNAARSALAALAARGSRSEAQTLSRLAGLVTADPDVDVRVLATTALGESANPAAREPLERVLNDPSENVASAAAEALGTIGAVESVPPLAKLVSGSGFWTRAAAVVALGRIGDASAVAPLAQAARDPGLAEIAAAALGDLRAGLGLAALEPLVAPGHPARGAAHAAAARILVANPELPPPAWLRRSLVGAESDLAERFARDGDEAAAHLLGITGTSEAARLLGDALSSPYVQEAALGFRALPEEVLAPRLAGWLAGATPQARGAVLASLPPLHRAETIDAVLSCLAAPDAETCAAAAEALARSDESLVLPRLGEALRDPATRHAAVRVLAIVGNQRCELLTPLLGDADVRVRRAAAEGLAACATPGERERIAAALDQEPDPTVRQALVEALGTAGGEAAVRRLEPLLQEADPALRFSVLTALGRTSAPEALPLLLSALDDPRPETQAVALRALGELGEASAALPIAEHLRDEDRHLRLAAAVALRDLATPRAVEFLIRALADPEWSVRQVAARTLGRIQATGALDRLRELARGDPDPLVRQAALDASAVLQHAAGLGGEA